MAYQTSEASKVQTAAGTVEVLLMGVLLCRGLDNI